MRHRAAKDVTAASPISRSWGSAIYRALLFVLFAISIYHGISLFQYAWIEAFVLPDYCGNPSAWRNPAVSFGDPTGHSKHVLVMRVMASRMISAIEALESVERSGLCEDLDLIRLYTCQQQVEEELTSRLSKAVMPCVQRKVMLTPLIYIDSQRKDLEKELGRLWVRDEWMFNVRRGLMTLDFRAVIIDVLLSERREDMQKTAITWLEDDARIISNPAAAITAASLEGYNIFSSYNPNSSIFYEHGTVAMTFSAAAAADVVSYTADSVGVIPLDLLIKDLYSGGIAMCVPTCVEHNDDMGTTIGTEENMSWRLVSAIKRLFYRDQPLQIGYPFGERISWYRYLRSLVRNWHQSHANAYGLLSSEAVRRSRC